jgi:hypothetical protein
MNRMGWRMFDGLKGSPMRRPLLPLTLALATAAVVGTAVPARAPDTPDKDLAGRTPGKPQMCIDETMIDDTHLYRDGHILYRMRGGPDYLNDAGPGCATSAINPVIVSSTISSQLCHGDILRIVDPTTHMFYGSCGLGDFTPYPRMKKAKP